MKGLSQRHAKTHAKADSCTPVENIWAEVLLLMPINEHAKLSWLCHCEHVIVVKELLSKHCQSVVVDDG